MDTAQQIEWAAKQVEALPHELSWRTSVLRQLQYCQAVLSGTEPPERLEELTMGFIAVRELEGWQPEELPRTISAVQYELQQRYLPYAAKVRLGIHRRT